MERHIGTWHKENDSSKSEVGELLIDGNHLEFYRRFHGLVFPETFIGEDGQFRYKVFVKDLIRRIVEFDSELHFQTMFLHKPKERPFLHTQEWLKTIEIESATQSEDSNS